MAQAEAYAGVSDRTTSRTIASLSHARRYVWLRFGAGRQLTSTESDGPVALSVGPEVTMEGSPDYRSYQARAVLALEFPRAPGSLEFRGGSGWALYDDDSHGTRPYGGVGLTREF
jgi:hypothetical protein